MPGPIQIPQRGIGGPRPFPPAFIPSGAAQAQVAGARATLQVSAAIGDALDVARGLIQDRIQKGQSIKVSKMAGQMNKENKLYLEGITNLSDEELENTAALEAGAAEINERTIGGAGLNSETEQAIRARASETLPSFQADVLIRASRELERRSRIAGDEAAESLIDTSTRESFPVFQESLRSIADGMPLSKTEQDAFFKLKRRDGALRMAEIELQKDDADAVFETMQSITNGNMDEFIFAEDRPKIRRIAQQRARQFITNRVKSTLTPVRASDPRDDMGTIFETKKDQIGDSIQLVSDFRDAINDAFDNENKADEFLYALELGRSNLDVIERQEVLAEAKGTGHVPASIRDSDTDAALGAMRWENQDREIFVDPEVPISEKMALMRQQFKNWGGIRQQQWSWMNAWSRARPEDGLEIAKAFREMRNNFASASLPPRGANKVDVDFMYRVASLAEDLPSLSAEEIIQQASLEIAPDFKQRRASLLEDLQFADDEFKGFLEDSLNVEPDDDTVERFKSLVVNNQLQRMSLDAAKEAARATLAMNGAGVTRISQDGGKKFARRSAELIFGDHATEEFNQEARSIFEKAGKEFEFDFYVDINIDSLYTPEQTRAAKILNPKGRALMFFRRPKEGEVAPLFVEDPRTPGLPFFWFPNKRELSAAGRRDQAAVELKTELGIKNAEENAAFQALDLIIQRTSGQLRSNMARKRMRQLSNRVRERGLFAQEFVEELRSIGADLGIDISDQEIRARRVLPREGALQKIGDEGLGEFILSPRIEEKVNANP